jgi:hypothetical protein
LSNRFSPNVFSSESNGRKRPGNKFSAVRSGYWPAKGGRPSARSPARTQFSQANEVVNYRTDRFEDSARDVDIVFDTVGRETLKRLWSLFKPRGRVIIEFRFLYFATGITPAMSMRLPGIGSQYLWATMDANKEYFDGAKTYKVTLPKDIPEANFWSFTLYDNQTRSMLDTPQRYPRAGSQSYPSPATEPNADGSTTVYFGPNQPEGVKRGNWIQTMPDKGWFTILRLYSPLEPFFEKTWRPSEIELVQ